MSLDTAAEARGSVTWKVRGGYALLLEADVYIMQGSAKSRT